MITGRLVSLSPPPSCPLRVTTQQDDVAAASASSAVDSPSVPPAAAPSAVSAPPARAAQAMPDVETISVFSSSDEEDAADGTAHDVKKAGTER